MNKIHKLPPSAFIAENSVIKELNEDSQITEVVYPSYLIQALIHYPEGLSTLSKEDIPNLKECFQYLAHGDISYIRDRQKHDISFLKFQKKSENTTKEKYLPFLNLENVKLYVVVNQKNELVQNKSRVVCKRNTKPKIITNRPMICVFFSKTEAEDYKKSLRSYDFFATHKSPLKVISLDFQTIYSFWETLFSQVILLPTTSKIGKTLYISEETFPLDGKQLFLVGFEKDVLKNKLQDLGIKKPKIKAENFNEFLLKSQLSEVKNYHFFMPFNNGEEEIFDLEKEKGQFPMFIRFRDALLVNPLSYRSKVKLISQTEFLPTSKIEEFKYWWTKTSRENDRERKYWYKRFDWYKTRQKYRKKKYWLSGDERRPMLAKEEVARYLNNLRPWRLSEYQGKTIYQNWPTMQAVASKRTKLHSIKENNSRREAVILEYLARDKQKKLSSWIPSSRRISNQYWRLRFLLQPELKNKGTKAEILNLLKQKDITHKNTGKEVLTLKEIAKKTYTLKK